MRKKRVFISFDFDQDKALKDLLIGQAHNPACPFEVIDSSLKEAAPEEGWEEKARDKIHQADLLIGRRDGPHRRVPGAGILYRRTWENMKKIIC
jgi:hypothetical protein